MKLIIIDIDDTFIYHRTVAIANKLVLGSLNKLCDGNWRYDKIYTTEETIRIFLRNFSRIRLKDSKSAKRLVVLGTSGMLLYFIEVIRKMYNFIAYKLKLPLMSSKLLISVWSWTVKHLKIKKKEYKISREIMKRSIYRKPYNMLKRIKKGNYVVAISEHIYFNEDPIKEILQIDELYENKFGEKYSVEGPKDKLRIAKEVIERIKPESVILFIDDYDDYSLLELDNIIKIIRSEKV